MSWYGMPVRCMCGCGNVAAWLNGYAPGGDWIVDTQLSHVLWAREW